MPRRLFVQNNRPFIFRSASPTQCQLENNDDVEERANVQSTSVPTRNDSRRNHNRVRGRGRGVGTIGADKQRQEIIVVYCSDID